MDNDENILIRYIDGVLSSGEKEAFEKELDTNATLRDELEKMRSAKEAVRLFGLKQQVGNIHEEMMGELSASRRSYGAARRILRYSIAVAASLLLILGAWIVYNFVTLSSEKVYGSKYQVYELVNVRGNEPAESALEEAYRAKNYKLVLKLHGGKNEKNTRANFLAGLSALELNDNVNAIEYFKNVLAENAKNKKRDFNDEAEY